MDFLWVLHKLLFSLWSIIRIKWQWATHGLCLFHQCTQYPIQNLTQLNMMRLVNRSPADQYLPNNLPSVQSSPPSIWPPCSVPRWSSCLVCVPAKMMTVVTGSPFKKFYLGQKHVWGSSVSKRAGFLSNTHHALHLYTFFSVPWQVQDMWLQTVRQSNGVL